MKNKDNFKELWQTLEKENYSKLGEENVEYHLGKEHDKIFRTLLDNKEDTAKFINKTFKLHIKEEDLEKYNSSFVSKIFQNREADIVYKMKEKNIFFLIEHQTKIDYSMPYRILEYEMLIMRSAIDLKKIKNKAYKLPIVVPIVLYTGSEKWNANKFLEDSQEKLEGIKSSLGRYNLVDINDCTEEELLEDDIFISKMMLLEKTKNTQETVDALEKIISNVKEKDKDTLKRIITIILGEKIGEIETKELINKIEGGKREMLAVVEMIRKENQMYKKEGEFKKKVEIVKKMLKEKFDLETVSKITGMKKKEIEKIQRELKK